MKRATLTKNMKMTMMNELTPDNIGKLALEAMLVEVSVTPKPGLVDRNNSGAHKDMDFIMFMKSAANLTDALIQFAFEGRDAVHLHKLLPVLRRVGLVAEKFMFHATGGVNTHKGEIFSLGILCGVIGHIVGFHTDVNVDVDDVLEAVKVMCSGLCERDFAEARKKSPHLLTKGERVYLEYGITGVRGEAENGYPVVMNHALPALKKYLADGFTLNDAMAFTLIHIMAFNVDTNIIARHDVDTAKEVMQISRSLITEGLTIDTLRVLDEEFIRRNISPSGSADLLAVTYFLHKIERLYISAQ